MDMKAHGTWLDLEGGLKNYEVFMGLRKQNPNIKLIIALGGWNDSEDNGASYKKMMCTAANRAQFVK